jgi:uncharacterized damage-inducible protein DinB
MGISDTLLPEFDHETVTTRVVLECVPEAQAAWRPHARSRSLGELAMHIAQLPVWMSIALERKEFDANPPDGRRMAVAAFESGRQLLQVYDANVALARTLLTAATDGELMVQWTLKNGGRVLYTLPRVAAVRSFMLNHTVHHRGQLTVYLRLLDVPLPNVYGPTADVR